MDWATHSFSFEGPDRTHSGTLHKVYLARAARRVRLGCPKSGVGTDRLAYHLVWEDTFDGRFEDRAYAIEVFERNNEAVRRRVPPGRLLVFDVREGWEPLCDFLGVEVPDRPFPHLNEAREMRRRLLGLVALSAAVPALAIAVSIATMVFLVRRIVGSGYR